MQPAIKQLKARLTIAEVLQWDQTSQPYNSGPFTLATTVKYYSAIKIHIRWFAIHDFATIAKVWTTADHSNTYIKTLRQAAILRDKFNRLYPLHVLAKEWPRDTAKT